MGIQSFYDQLKCKREMHSADDLITCLDDINGQFCRHVDGFDGVHGGYGADKRKLEGRMILECCLEEGIMCIKHMVFNRGKEEDDIQNG